MLKRFLLILGCLVGFGARADIPAVHGMLLFGEERIYMSHLPMFHTPHDYQVLLEVKLPDKIKSAYLADRKRTGMKLYTFVPKKFVLPDFQKKPFALEGDIYRGHFERGGEEILNRVMTEVPRILHFRKLDPEDSRPEVPTYFLFGFKDELFIAHTITSRPNFDQVASVKLAQGDQLFPEEVGIVAITAEGEGDTRLEKPTAIQIIKPETKTTLESVDEFYFEEAELK